MLQKRTKSNTTYKQTVIIWMALKAGDTSDSRNSRVVLLNKLLTFTNVGVRNGVYGRHRFNLQVLSIRDKASVVSKLEYNIGNMELSGFFLKNMKHK